MRDLRPTAMLCAVIAAFGFSAAAQTVVDPNLTVSPVVTSGSLSQPISMVFVSSTEILVGEKATGKVKRVQGGVVNATAALDLGVESQSEYGLLGMTLDPQFSTNHYVYIYYTKSSTAGDSTSGLALANRIGRFTWDGSALTGETIIYTSTVLHKNHNGGIMKFGPPTAAPADQKLFVVIGNHTHTTQCSNYSAGGAPEDGGVIIRINPDGSTPTGAEKGPFYDVAGGNAALEHMYAYGIRNSFGIAFDPSTGNLWETENGNTTYDELNLVGSAFNSGWEDIMGPDGAINGNEAATSRVQFSGVGTYSDPEFSWYEPCAVTSIVFLNSTALGASYQNDCFVGSDLAGVGGSGTPIHLYHFKMNTPRDGFDLAASTHGLGDKVFDFTNASDTDGEIVFGNDFGVIVDLEVGQEGALYVTSLTNNQIYKIYDPAAAPVVVSGFSAE